MKYVLVISIHADPAMAPGYEEWGGTHIYMKELIDGFAVRKINCVMFTRKSFPLKDIENYNEYCTVIRLHNGEAEPIDKTILWHYHEENLTQIQAFINENGKPEIIHSVYWNSGRLAMALGEKNNIPFVHSVISNSKGRVFRGAVETVQMRSEYEQQIYEKAKWIICVSDDERNDIMQFYNIPQEKIMVAGQYVNEAFLLPSHDVNGFPCLHSELNLEEREIISQKFNTAYSIQTNEHYWNYKVFTYMGRVGFNKGLEQIIKGWYRLFKHYKKSCPPLWIAGGSILEIHKIREVLKADILDIETLERNRLIVWWGYLDPAGLSTILLKTMALIMHSYYEPGGRVIVEAMAEGIPVIATPYGFGKDYIVDWYNGFLIKYGDIDELYFRLAHFIHQPYLSNALGQNARQNAKQIIKTWNFIDNHLVTYGLQFSQILTPENKMSAYDHFRMRKINLFPYCNFPLSENYFIEFVSRITNEEVLECRADTGVPATSDIYRIKTSKKRIVIKQTFTRLRIGPMFNPFDKERYVKKAEKSFRVELDAYKRLASKTLLGYDATHYLFALKELEPIKNIDIPILCQCINYIVNKIDTATTEEKSTYCHIAHKKLLTKNDILSVYNQLEQKLPDYYFERSGCFSEYIGWASAPFILSFNRNNFPRKLYKELQVICKYFLQAASFDTKENLRNINADIEFKHFMFDNGNIEMVDLEKNSIGIIESELADLLYDYWYILDKGNCISELLVFLPQKVNKHKVLSYIAHICFYDIQVKTVMQRTVPGREFKLLQSLFQEAKIFAP